MKKQTLMLPLAALLIAGSITGAVGIAHADTSTTTTQSADKGHGTPPVASGTVTAVNGDTITLDNKRNNTTYTVDASSATITKRTAPAAKGEKPISSTITVSEVAVGDMLSVQGTVSGTDITATSITDGNGGFGGGMGSRDPGVMGTVTAVNGSTITITNKDGTTYTVDASGADVTKMETISASDVQVGDSIGVQGTVSGDSVTAKSVMDGMPAARSKSSSQTASASS